MALTLVGGGIILATCVGFFFFAAATNPDTWVPVLVAVMLILLGIPFIHSASRNPPDKRLRRILIAGLLLKLLATGPRYYLNEGFYKGEGDAARYTQAGSYLVQNMGKGQFSIEGSELTKFPKETRVVGYVTGVLYLFFGTSYFGGYLVFSWLSWLGLLCFFKAFRIAYPNAPPYRAATLLFFFPSLLFWASSLGKDALMVFLVGLLTLGVSRLLALNKPWLGVTWMVLAGTLMAQIRPHVLLIAAIALAGSSMASPHRDVGRRGGLMRLLVVVMMVPLMVSVIGRMDTLMGTTGGGTIDLEEVLSDTAEQTAIGGSAFSPQPVRSPLDLPTATVTVLFRPFIFEARSLAVMISALEGTLLLALCLVAGRWLWRLGPAMYRSSFAAFCGFYVLAFVVAFSSISNAGILSRQRVQMLPLLMLLACAAHEHYRTARVAAEVADPGDLPERRAGLPSRDPVPSTPVPSVAS